MYCHYIGWCIGKSPLYRGVLYSECLFIRGSTVVAISDNGQLPICLLFRGVDPQTFLKRENIA